MRLSEQFQFMPLLEPADYQAGSQDLDSINMALFHSVTIAIQMGAITGNDAYIKLWTGATAGTKTTEIAFKYRLSTVDTGSASADVFGAPTLTVVATGIAMADRNSAEALPSSVSTVSHGNAGLMPAESTSIRIVR